MADLLTELVERFGAVAVVSGRPVTYLVGHLPAAVDLYGLYGLEARVAGVRSQHPAAEAWRAAVDEVARQAGADGPTGVDVEHKGLSVTLHLRRRPHLHVAARQWAEEAAQRSGLALRTAKMSFELHPPIEVDKGTVVEARAQGMTAACYVGDDAGDLPAFAALDRLAARGLATAKVAVATAESVPALLEQADVVVDGPAGAVVFLRGLL